MTSTTTDRRLGVNGNLPMKAPVRAATTANITLSGLQTIDGVALAADDRVLVKNQTTTTENGIYVASTSSWTRDVDANGNRDFVKGTTVGVTDGSTLAGSYWRISTANPITIGTSTLSWERALASSLTTLSFTQSGADAVARDAQEKMREVVSAFDFLTTAQIADVQARTLSLDLTTALQAAHTAAAGRPVFYPKGAYKFSVLTLANVGAGILGEGSGGMNGDDTTLLVSTTTGNAITLTTSTAHNVQLRGFTLKQNAGSATGKGIVATDCYWLTTEDLRVRGFVDGLYISKGLYHHHRRLLAEFCTNGAHYYGSAGTWNVDWFNNVITFDTCRFTDNTAIGCHVKGTEVVFINPDASNQSTTGAIGLKVVGESTSFKAHGIRIVTPYIEDTKIGFSFQYAKVEIEGDGYIQGGANVGAQAKSIIDADNSTVTWTSVEDKDYWEFGYRLTNSSTLVFTRSAFSGSIRASSTLDATSKALTDDYDEGSFTGTLTGVSGTVTATFNYVRKGRKVEVSFPALLGTSTSNACTVTGVPANIRPATAVNLPACVQDNSTNVNGSVNIGTTGTITLYNGIVGAATSFTAANNKGLVAGSLSWTTF